MNANYCDLQPALKNSEHPLASAIVSGAQERGVEVVNAQSFESVTGKGVKGKVNGTQRPGEQALTDDLRIASVNLVTAVEELRATVKQ